MIVTRGKRGASGFTRGRHTSPWVRYPASLHTPLFARRSLAGPCKDRKCGTPCSTCTGPICPAVMEWCNSDGRCSTSEPLCTPGVGLHTNHLPHTVQQGHRLLKNVGVNVWVHARLTLTGNHGMHARTHTHTHRHMRV